MADNTQEQPNLSPRRGKGRPFEPGKSGNPGGRPREVAEIRELARKHGPEAIKKLVALMYEADSDAVRVRAAEALLNRGYGMPTQAITGEDGVPLVINVVKFGEGS